jgi:hypothetical protein
MAAAADDDEERVSEGRGCLMTTMPGLHEGRLRAMLDPDSLADWGLNDEDRDAVRWALDAINRLKAERDEIRSELINERRRIVEIQRAVERVRDEADRALESSRRATP